MDFKHPPKAQTVERYDGVAVHVKSKNEANFAGYLNWLYDCKAIEGWQYEPREFTFPRRRGVTCYRPDFRAMWVQPEGEEVYYECKVSLVGRDITKFRLMQQYYPGVDLVLVMDRKPKATKRILMLGEAAKYVGGVLYFNQLPLYRKGQR